MAPETQSEKDLDELEAKLGVTFINRNLLKQALTHESYVNEWNAEIDRTELRSYERLEFLGDAVLNFTVANALFEQSGSANEGELSMGRADIVCKDSLAKAADRLSLGEYILRGKGETAFSPNIRDSVLEDSFEAIIGAIHIDRGFDAACQFIFDQLGHQIEHVAEHGVEKDPKSAFQELVQGAGLKTPRYQTETTNVDSNGEPQYLARVMVGGRQVAAGVGLSKSKAQKNAAAKARVLFADGIPDEFAKMTAQRARSGRARLKSESAEPSTKSRSQNWRRVGNLLGILGLRKSDESARRRLVYRRSD